jgi:hypothetical protein
MDNLTLGVALAVLGMGGTLLTLLLISFVVDVLKRLFPEQPPAPPPAAKEAPPSATPIPPASGSV